MEYKTFISDFLSVSNAYGTENYLHFWHKNATLDDPSVGEVFKGHSGIRKYFEDYFIGYKTQTRLVKMEIINDNEIHTEVEFTGEFPGGKIGGTFDFSFKDGKIENAKAELI